jgi:hypothetical protein
MPRRFTQVSRSAYTNTSARTKDPFVYVYVCVCVCVCVCVGDPPLARCSIRIQYFPYQSSNLRLTRVSKRAGNRTCSLLPAYTFYIHTCTYMHARGKYCQCIYACTHACLSSAPISQCAQSHNQYSMMHPRRKEWHPTHRAHFKFTPTHFYLTRTE